jgi:hypothetical protein
MGKKFGINERIFKFKIPFTKLFVIAYKSYCSQSKFLFRSMKTNWATNKQSVLEGLHSVYSIDIAKGGVWYNITFVK